MKYFLLTMLLPLLGLAQTKPNIIINGDAVLDQRASATITIPSGGAGTEYGPDRFRGGNNSSVGVGRIMQGTTTSTDAPYILGLRNTIKYVATSAHAPTGTEATTITNRLEGLDFYPYGKKTMTHSFWVRSKKTGAFCVSIKTASGDRTYTKEFTIASADTWQEVSHAINFAQATGGTEWLNTNGIGISMFYYLSSGSTVATGTSGSWSNSNLSVTTACRSNNLLASINDYVEITGVRLTEGAQKVPFVRAGGGSYPAELALGERYTQCLSSSGLGISSFLAAGKWFQTVTHSTPLRVAATGLFRTDGGALTGLDCGSGAGNVYVPAQSGANPATCTAGSAFVKIDTDLTSNPKMTFLSAGGTSISGTAGVLSPSMGIQSRTLCLTAEL